MKLKLITISSCIFISFLCYQAQAQSNTSTNSCSTSCDNSSCSSESGCVTCKPVLLPFSQGENRARDYASVSHLQFLTHEHEINWYTSLAIAFEQNFKRNELGSYFFPNGTNTITVGPNAGAGVDVRNTDIGLSNTFEGTLTISPRIRNVIAEPTVYVGFDKWIHGGWLWFKLPITNTRWDLDCCESDSTLGGATFPNGEMSNTSPVFAPASGTSNQIEQAFGGTLTWGDKHCPLKAARIICCEDRVTGIADFPVHYGWNFIRRDRGYIGYYSRIVFPTGRIKNRRSLFDATIGYNRWQLGSGLNAGLTLYENDNTSLRIIGDGYLAFIFNRKQCRVFDLTENGCFSRYLLMQVADANGNYTGQLVNFVDVFTFCAKSRFDWDIDALVFLEGKHHGWTAQAGYEFKWRDKEKFEDCLRCDVCDPCMEDGCDVDCCLTSASLIGTKQFGIKGNLNVSAVGSPVVTASKSTISTAAPADATPVLININNVTDQLDICGAAIPRACSHKVWGDVAYTWEDRDYPIFIGLGGQAEFGHNNKALSLWSIWAKGGFAYH